MTLRPVTARAFASVALLWLAQPPLGWWPLAFIALVPWLDVIAMPTAISRRTWGTIYAASLVYWLFTMQGLRHAHPLMFLCWFALSAYLAVYHVAFVALARRLVQRGTPLVVAAPLVWVATECVRNYLLTGISAVMLGHTMADVPWMIQIADLAGSYGIGFVIVCVNVACWTNVRWRGDSRTRSTKIATVSLSSVLLLFTIAYGIYRTSQPMGQPLATFALLQRDEAVEYEQSADRELEIFRGYGRQAIAAVADSDRPIDVIVWPESMFTGGMPLVSATDDAVMPPQYVDAYPEAADDPALFRSMIADQRGYFYRRSDEIQSVIAAQTDRPAPAILAGCGVVHYTDAMNVYSGVVWIDGDGDVVDWYGKTHLVMFGEYIPIAPWIPGLRSLIPPGMGLQTGDGGDAWKMGETTVAPNICIETAVERVTVDQVRKLNQAGKSPDVIVTVTNDGWFDHSSILDHHLRCAQLVAVGIRRPVLSAANNGPTASIDGNGQVVARLETGVNNTLVVTPTRDTRSSLYLHLGALPAWLCVTLTIMLAKKKQPTDNCQLTNNK